LDPFIVGGAAVSAATCAGADPAPELAFEAPRESYEQWPDERRARLSPTRLRTYMAGRA